MKGDPHLDDITCLAIKGDDLLFSGSRDCTIKIWNINSF
jgi:WD40 repeat protein